MLVLSENGHPTQVHRTLERPATRIEGIGDALRHASSLELNDVVGDHFIL
jgi:hypothetical protein